MKIKLKNENQVRVHVHVLSSSLTPTGKTKMLTGLDVAQEL